jgi:DNA-directed RNA polymerase subunit F
MRIDISNLPLPDSEAVTLLKAEVRRLEGVIAASQPTLTYAERAAIEYFSKWETWKAAAPHAEALLALLERTK